MAYSLRSPRLAWRAKMAPVRDAVYYLFHPQEFRAIIQWKLWRNPAHKRDESNESQDLKDCYRFLDLTSRSFVSVIQELPPDLLVPIIIFYLILRGLDTIEDDMTLSLKKKEPLLRDFYTYIDNETWNFKESGPDEHDRELLINFDSVTREFNKLEDEYKIIIKDTTKRMGNGMADFVKKAHVDPSGVKTVKEYELYCHYVAGLLGEGLTRLFIEAKLADPMLLQKPELSESMGQFLQQTNITRDVREDHDDKRYFWPREVWSKYVDRFGDLFLPQNQEKALQCSSEMVLMALNRAEELLLYMSGIKEDGVFNFVAIPQVMAIATLELCFQNPAIFQRNVKMSRGTACSLMIEATTSMPNVCEVFKRYARKVQKKNNSSDPFFAEINIACGKVELFVESYLRGPTPRKAKLNKGVLYPTLLFLATFGVILALMVSNSLYVWPSKWLTTMTVWLRSPFRFCLCRDEAGQFFPVKTSVGIEGVTYVYEYSSDLYLQIICGYQIQYNYIRPSGASPPLHSVHGLK